MYWCPVNLSISDIFLGEICRFCAKSNLFYSWNIYGGVSVLWYNHGMTNFVNELYFIKVHWLSAWNIFWAVSFTNIFLLTSFSFDMQTEKPKAYDELSQGVDQDVHSGLQLLLDKERLR